MSSDAHTMFLGRWSDHTDIGVVAPSAIGVYAPLDRAVLSTYSWGSVIFHHYKYTIYFLSGVKTHLKKIIL